MRTRLALVLLLACSTPAAALERGFWLAGLAWLEGEGEWSARRLGLSAPGGYGVLRIETARQDPWDALRRRRLRLSVRDLGLPVASAVLEAGSDGRGRLALSWMRTASDEGRAATPYRGVGTGRLGLPAGWRAASTTAGLGAPGARPIRFEYGKGRERLSLAWRRFLRGGATLDLAAERESRQGLKAFGAVVGTTGGNARAVILPMPVDETSYDLRTTIGGGGADRAWRVGARLSEYRDRVGALVWEHPFAGVAGLPPEAGWPRALGKAATAPGNRAVSLDAAGWWRPFPGWILNAEAMIGRHRQDRPFLPYTIHPDWQVRLLAPLPRESLDGEVRNERFAARAERRLDPRTDFAVAVRHERRDDRTLAALFRQVPSDAGPQPALPDARWRWRLPVDWRERALWTSLAHRWARGQRLDLRVETRATARSFAERERTREHLLAAEGMTPGPWATRLSFHAERALRRGDAYLGERPFLAAFLPEYVATLPGGFENAPELRRPHLADRERHAFRARLDRALGEDLTLALRFNRVHDDYERSTLGLLHGHREVIALELSRSLGEDASLQGFALRERAESAQAGHSFRGGANRLPDLADPGRRWRVTQRDLVDALGLAARLPAGQGRVDLSLTALRHRTLFGVEAGRALSAAPLPELGGRMLIGSVRGTFPLRAGLSLVAEWRGERHRFRDPLTRELAADQLASVLLATPASREGPAQLLLLALRAEFP